MIKTYTAIINHGKKNKTIQGSYSEVLGQLAEAMLDGHVNSIIIYNDSEKLIRPIGATYRRVGGDETEG